jgi:allantoate deiminase
MDASESGGMGERIVARIEALAAISESPDALTRVSFSPEHRRAADLILSWMCEAGLAARMDEIGNVVGRLEGEAPGLPCLMLGSHYDTVRNAGKWDGPLGVLTALECVGEVARRGLKLPFALEVVGFCDEEGARFSSTLLGSRAIAGGFDTGVLEARDVDGISLREAVRIFGLNPGAIGRAGRHRRELLGYVELHIEQGPVLEAEDLPVGVVTAINGAARFRIELEGMAGHAGTVPMTLRRDALAGAADIILAIERICGEGADLVGTVGEITAEPGAANVIPGCVRFSLDLRSPDNRHRDEAEDAILEAIDEVAHRRGLKARIRKVHESATAACAPWLRAQLAEAIRRKGYRLRELASGAGHDGMAMIGVTDIAMLFVRCRGGVSHHPGEHAETADVDAGARVLLDFIENFRPGMETGE